MLTFQFWMGFGIGIETCFAVVLSIALIARAIALQNDEVADSLHPMVRQALRLGK